MATSIIRLTGMAAAVIALGACRGKPPEADQRALIIQSAVGTCVRGFEARKSQTPGVAPPGLDSQRLCECAVGKLAEGKSAEQLRVMDSDHSLTPGEGQVVSSCLNEEARRAGVIEPDYAPAANRSRTANSSAGAATPAPPAAPAAPRTADRPTPRASAPTPRPRSSDPIATPVSPPRVATPVAPPRPAAPPPAPAQPRTGGPTSLLPRNMTTPTPPPPRPPAPRPSSTRPPPEG